MLAPGSRLFVTMIGRSETPEPSASCPIQFTSSNKLTEIPGSVIGFHLHANARTTAARDDSVPARIPTLTLQLSPDRMWDVARAQVNEAVTAVGLTVAKMHNIGNGTGLTLAVSANGPSSPSQTDLNSFNLAAATRWMQQNAMHLKGSMHWGQFFERLCRLKDPQGLDPYEPELTRHVASTAATGSVQCNCPRSRC